MVVMTYAFTAPRKGWVVLVGTSAAEVPCHFPGKMLEMDSPTRHILLLQIKDGIDSAAENQQRKYRCVAYFGIIRWG